MMHTQSSEEEIEMIAFKYHINKDVINQNNKFKNVYINKLT